MRATPTSLRRNPRGGRKRRVEVPRTRSRITRATAFALTTAVVALGLVAVNSVAVSSPAQAVPGTPGVPQDPTTLYLEDFENGTGATSLQDYSSTQGVEYTADDYWLSTPACNGFIATYEAPRPTAEYCEDEGQYDLVRAKAYGLGLLNTPENATTNRALSTNSNDVPGAVFAPNEREFATVGQVPLPTASGRFVTFSADAAATGCVFATPLLRFYLRDGAGTEIPISTSPIDPCADPQERTHVPGLGFSDTDPVSEVYAGTYAANSSILFTGGSLGVVLRNEATSMEGNDGAIDNIRILDVTPQLDKSFSPAQATTGGTSTLTFTITNTSELAAKSGWSFTDALPAGLSVATPTAASTTCTDGAVTAVPGGAAITVSGDLDADQASCTVSVNVTSSVPGTYTNGPGNITQTGLNPPADAIVEFAAPAISLVKSAGTPTDVDADGLTDEGDTIPYSFLVTNTGDVALSGVVVSDSKAPGVVCPSPTLAVGASQTCTVVYTVTAADVAAGSVVNVATATGTPTGRPPVTSTPSSTTTPVTAPAPELTLVKSATPSTAASFVVGQTISYSFLVTNTGNVPVTGIAIAEDSFTGSGVIATPTCPGGTLAVDASITCSTSYLITQADVDLGSLDNTARALGTAVGGGDVSSAPDDVTIPAALAPALEVTKSATPTTVTAVGQTVTYSFLVENTGNVSLSAIGIAETAFSGTGASPVATCPAGGLAPAATVTCTATYAATQADLDAGAITNTAIATATAPGGEAVTSDPSSAEVAVLQDAALSILKTSDTAVITEAGETIAYSFAVTNDGNVTVSDVTVAETAFSGTGELSALVPATVASLAPGATTTFTATYVVTQADLDSGELTNTATTSGTTPDGDPTDPSDPSTVETPTAADASISVVKSVAPAAAGDFVAGSELTYSFVATNTGNVTLTGVTIDETAFSGTGELSDVVCAAGAASLAPGAQVLCTADYVLTQADIDAGEVTNTAIATGTPVAGDPGAPVVPVASSPSNAVVPAEADPSLSLVKTADADAIDAAGQTVTYSFTVTNTGNVTITDPAIDDTEFSGTGELSAIEGPSGTVTLIPGQTVVFTATYLVSQADVDAGELTNTATATAITPDGDPTDPTPPSTVIVPTDAAPSLALVKTADRASVVGVGQMISYSFTITNTGNVTQTGVTVDEVEFTGTGVLGEITCDDGALSVAPGASIVCSTSYRTTDADVRAGAVSNTAVALGTPSVSSSPGTPTSSAPSTARVAVTATPATPAGLAATGSELTSAALIAGLLLLAGGLLLPLARRRRQSSH